MVPLPRRRAGAVRGRDPGCGNSCPVRSGTSPRQHGACAVVRRSGLPTLMVMLVSVAFVSASIDVDGTENLNERYLFYVVPLLFVGLALWVEEGLPRPRPWAWGVVLVPAALVLTLPIDRLVYNSGLQSTALLPWVALPISGWRSRPWPRRSRSAVATCGCAAAARRCGTTLGRGPRRHVRRRRCRPVDPRRRGLERVEALRGAPSELGRRIAPGRRRGRRALGSACRRRRTSRTPSTRG